MKENHCLINRNWSTVKPNPLEAAFLPTVVMVTVLLPAFRAIAPVTREVQALNDLEWHGNLEMHFVPYN